MTFKTLLVHLDASDQRAARLEVAFHLAVRFDAHVVGLFAMQRLEIPPYILSEAGMNLERYALDIRQAAADEAKAQFDDQARKAQYAARAEWRQTLEQDALEMLLRYARYADLVIAGQPDADDPGGVPATYAHELVMSAGRPVLYVPAKGRFDAVGRRVLVAWNGSREATRAVKDGLPLLPPAEEAEVVTYDREKVRPAAGDLPDPDLAMYLARHGARASIAAESSRGEEIGELILQRARAKSADVIVMGAYSHSRLRELVLGGATRTVFRSMHVPVLMSR
jgi:nucleotide-binding universal stress UspA family protein